MSGHENNVVILPVEDLFRREVATLWETLRSEAALAVHRDRALARAMNAAVLRHASFGHALSHRLSIKLEDHDVDRDELLAVIDGAYTDEPDLLVAAVADLQAVKDRDPSNTEMLTPFLYFKGFSALQAYRVGHRLWKTGRRHLARHIQSRISETFAIDIHPAAAMGRGIMLDHGSGLVIGETAVVEDEVSILQSVTLGGTGKDTGDRHPKVRRGVLIGAGAHILGNIEIGMGAKVGAGSVVIAPVAPYTSVAGVPARPVGRPHSGLPGVTMDQVLSEPDYVI